jgi:hypothetical protein
MAFLSDRSRLLRLLLTLELLYLSALLLDLLLLRLNLLLGLLVGGFLVLHMVADRVTSHAAKRAADGGSRAWSADSGPDDCARRGSDARTAKRPFLTG